MLFVLFSQPMREMLPWQPNFYVMYYILTSIQSFSYMLHTSLDVHYSFRKHFKNRVITLTIFFQKCPNVKGLKDTVKRHRLTLYVNDRHMDNKKECETINLCDMN